MKHFACAAGLVLALSSASALAQSPETSPPAGDGRDLAMAKCSTCHGFGRVLAYKRTRVQWASTVEFMKDKGLEASDSEVKAIVDYLTSALPADPEPDAAPAANWAR